MYDGKNQLLIENPINRYLINSPRLPPMNMLIAACFAFGLFVGVLALMRLGWRYGRRRLAEDGEEGFAGLGAIEGSIYGLVGLLIAFTFTGAASRFSERRDLITQQVNAIGTVWQRLDLANGETRAQLRELLRRYVDVQLEVGHAVRDPAYTQAAWARSSALQAQVWSKATEAAREDTAQPLTMALLPPINQMFDIAESRRLMARQHPPVAIYLMLGALVFASALMAGFAMAKARRQSPLHVFGFATVMAVSVYLILDLEFPRLGLVRIDSFDQALVELRTSMD